MTSLSQSPFVMIIFGATGDLTRHKLMPALFSLYKQKQLPEKFFIVGFARRPFSDSAFADIFDTHLTQDPLWMDFAKNIYYQQGMFNERSGYEALIEKLNGFDSAIGACITRLIYLATPPDNYEPILSNLSESKLSEGCGQGSEKWTRLAIEKPFGKDLETAKALDKRLAEIFEEKQIFRVDHYLAKDTVQNMIAFRFANNIFEPVWNKDYIDHVQITWSEASGINGRGKFFDGVGMLRDVAQNHLMQLLAAVAMEQPKSFSKEGVRDARALVISQIVCPQNIETSVVRGQYESYKKEKDVAENSKTETYVAIKLQIDNQRFANVPFYLRAGKKLSENKVEMHIVFRQTCHILFKEYGCPEIGNVLTIRIQPDEGITMRFIAKEPGAKVALQPVKMHFSYSHEFGRHGTDAYEKLLLDILAGDQMLFNRSDELESSWDFITQILKGWEEHDPQLSVYPDGSKGPKEGDMLIEKDGRKWI